MEKITIKEVVQAIQGQLVTGSDRDEITGVSTDTRALQKGELFFALKGEKFDGNDFAAEAIEKGAGAVVVSRVKKGLTRQGTVIKVKDTLAALHNLARSYRRKFRPIVIGITGSNGKTTTKEMLKSILTRRYNVVSTPGNYNNLIGVPLTLFQITRDTQFVVLEMGTNHPGEIKKLAEISLPLAGVITNIGATHLQFFRCIANVLSAKMEMFDVIPKRGKAVINADDALLKSTMGQIKQKVVTFGISSDADIRAKDICTEEKGEEERISFIVERGDAKQKFILHCLGVYNIYNALAAISVAGEFALPLDLMASVLAEFDLPKLRMEKVKVGRVTIINDAYNANPTSMEKVLSEFVRSFPSRRKIAVLGDMLELGRMSKKLHREIGKIVAGSNIHVLITVGENARYIAQSAVESGMKRSNVFSFESKRFACRKLKESLQPGDVVLLKGSRKVGLEEIIKYLSW